MSRIVRPELIMFMGEEYEDTEQLARRIRQNETMGRILLRRRSLFESLYALAEADKENAGYWEELATECKQLYEDVWSGETEETTAWKTLSELLKRPMPEPPPTLEELRESTVASLQGKGMNEILRIIKKALDTDEWKSLFEEDAEAEVAYNKLKRIFSEKCTENFLKALDDKYRTYMKDDMMRGEAKAVSEYVIEWCLDGAAENLVKKEEGYPLNENSRTELYDAERAKLLKNSYFCTAAELLGYWDESLKQERGSTLKNSYGYETCKPGLEREEKKLRVLEDAYSLLATYRRMLADGTWLALWENSEAKGVERTAFFLLAAGKVGVDRTDFDRILREESGKRYTGTEGMELGAWYWNYGIDLAKRTSRVESDEYKCEVGEFRIPKPAEEAVRYILNELSKWERMDEKTERAIKKSARSRTLESGIRDAKKLSESCETYLKERQKEINATFDVSGPWDLVYRKKKVELHLNEKKKQGYYLVACEKPMYCGMAASKYYDVLKSVVMHHRYRKWIWIFKHVTFGWNRKNQKRYVRLYDSIDSIKSIKEICERFVDKRRRLHEKMRMECKKMRDRENELMDLTLRKYTEAKAEGLFQYWEKQWSDVNQAYSEFLHVKTEWEKEEAAHWDKEFSGFEKNCKTYRERVSGTFNDCYCLLKIKKAKRKKKRRKWFLRFLLM